MPITSRSLLATFLLALAACGSEKPVDLGEDRSEPLGSALSDYEGSWEGYAEALEFDDGTDTVRIELDDQGHGVLRVGDAADLPEPVADEVWPPPLPVDVLQRQIVPTGFDYPLSHVRVEDRRIRMDTNVAELYREWCELQTPHLRMSESGPDYYWPVPDYVVNDDGCFRSDDQTTPVPCEIAGSATTCECTAEACGLSSQLLAPDIHIDAALEGESFVGTLRWNSERIVVRLTKM